MVRAHTGRPLSADAIDELAHHIEDHYAALIAAGQAPDAALAQARQECRRLLASGTRVDLRMRRLSVAERVRRFVEIDVRHATRRLWRSPAFTSAAIVVLGLGLGLNTAVFSVINAVLWRPVGAANERGLVFVYDVTPPREPGAVSFAAFAALASHTDVFSALEGLTSDRNGWARVNGMAIHLRGAAVTGGYFDVLGVQPQLGRRFTEDDDRAAAPPVIMLSDSYWASAFQRDPQVLGRTLDLATGEIGVLSSAPMRPYTVIGVLPRGFTGSGMALGRGPDYWVLASQRYPDYACPSHQYAPGYPREPDFLPVGRLADGVSVAAAAAFVRAYRDESRRDGLPTTMLELRESRAVSLPFALPGRRVLPSQFVAGLLIVSALLLAVAASNLVGLLLARGVGASHDIAVRVSLGAGRGLVMRQRLTESVILALAGAAAGVPVALMLVRALTASVPASAAYASSLFISDISLDARVLSFAVVSALVIAIVIGIVPARQAAVVDVAGALHRASADSRERTSRVRRWVLVPQAAIALAFLLVAASVARTMVATEFASPGYEPSQLVEVEFSVPWPDGCGADQRSSRVAAAREAQRELTVRVAGAVRGLPSVAAATLGDARAYDMLGGDEVVVPDRGGGRRHIGVRTHGAGEEFFDVMRIPVRAGRTFVASEVQRPPSRTPDVVIVSDAFARSAWPGQPAIGQRLAFQRAGEAPPEQWAEVVGVVGDILPAVTDGWPAPTVYRPGRGSGVTAVLARARTSTADALRDIGDLIRAQDPSAIVTQATTFEAEIAARRFYRRAAVGLLTSAAGAGMLLAAIGLYGVVAYSLAQRVREFGVRTALGAGPVDLAMLVVREFVVIIGISAAAGVAIAMAAGGLLSHSLGAVLVPSIWLVAGGCVAVTVVFLAACYLPARRAADVDVAALLRS
jgi:predicted permease